MLSTCVLCVRECVVCVVCVRECVVFVCVFRVLAAERVSCHSQAGTES